MNDPFACPAPGCDVFPYDTAQDLAAHLISAHAGAPPATPTRFSAPKGSTPGRQAPVKVPVGVSTAAEPIDNRRDPVRVGGWSGTFAPPPAPRRTPAKNVRMATDPMKGFIRNLVADVPDAVLPDMDTLTFSAASTLIDDLKARKAAARVADRPAPTVVPEGFHVHDATVYKVQISKTSGAAYAKVLKVTEGAGTWEYAGARPLRHLSDATVATLEQAQEFGLRFGICMCCGRTLTNPESIELGIGPICRSKHF